MKVHNLNTALHAYWNAKDSREEQAAYHEILLFGGPDGYPSHGPFRTGIIRLLRKLAAWLEQ